MGISSPYSSPNCCCATSEFASSVTSVCRGHLMPALAVRNLTGLSSQVNLEAQPRALGNDYSPWSGLHLYPRPVLFSSHHQLGLDMEELEEIEEDAGLGNGGLGRLAGKWRMSILCCLAVHAFSDAMHDHAQRTRRLNLGKVKGMTGL